MQILFSIFFLVIIGVSSLSAQGKETSSWRKNLKFEVVGGANLTQLENYGEGPFYYFDYIPSWEVGIAAQYKWDGFISMAIQPELRYNKVITEIVMERFKLNFSSLFFFIINTNLFLLLLLATCIC